MPLVRRAFPQLFSNVLVGVQPVTQPQGLATAMRYIYGGSDSYNYDPMSECYTIDEENEEPSIDDILKQAWNSVPSYNSTSPFKQPYKAPTIKTQFKKQKRKR